MIIIRDVNDDHAPAPPLRRLLAPLVEKALETFPVVVITGARQTGKSTLARISESSAPGQRQAQSGESMRKAKNEMEDWLRPEYERSDFGKLVRGKYASRLARETNVVVLDPEIAAAFPTDAAVNEALHGLLELARSSVRKTSPATRSRR